MASTMVDTMKPNAVSIDGMVTSCSRNSSRRYSACVISSFSFSIHSIVSRMQLSCVRSASRLAAAASSLSSALHAVLEGGCYTALFLGVVSGYFTAQFIFSGCDVVVEL